jgi:hypothetical protein
LRIVQWMIRKHSVITNIDCAGQQSPRSAF